MNSICLRSAKGGERLISEETDKNKALGSDAEEASSRRLSEIEFTPY